MTKYAIILDNGAGELDRKVVTVGDDPELAEAVRDFIMDIGSLRDGDSITIKEIHP